MTTRLSTESPVPATLAPGDPRAPALGLGVQLGELAVFAAGWLGALSVVLFAARAAYHDDCAHEDGAPLQVDAWLVLLVAAAGAARARFGHVHGARLAAGAVGGAPWPWLGSAAAHAALWGVVLAARGWVRASALVLALLAWPVATAVVAPRLRGASAMGCTRGPAVAVAAVVVASLTATVAGVFGALAAEASARPDAPVERDDVVVLAVSVVVVVAALALIVATAVVLVRRGRGAAAIAARIWRPTQVITIVGMVALALTLVGIFVLPAVAALVYLAPRRLARAAADLGDEPWTDGAVCAALGWLLLGHGLVAAALTLPAALAGAPPAPAAMLALIPGAGLDVALPGLALAALELAAARALLRGGRRLAAAWIVAAVAVAASAGGAAFTAVAIPAAVAVVLVAAARARDLVPRARVV